MEERVYRLDDQVGHLLRRANQRHLGLFAEVIPEVTTTQFAALARLRPSGPMSQNQLGRATAMDAATIKGVVGRLVNRRLVTTAPSAEDRRRLIVDLTPAGRSLVEELRPRGLRGHPPHPRAAVARRAGAVPRAAAQAGLTPRPDARRAVAHPAARPLQSCPRRDKARARARRAEQVCGRSCCAFWMAGASTPRARRTPSRSQTRRTSTGFGPACPHAQLAAHGPAVGLPEGQMGDSEVGHTNIGAGRVVWMDLPRIDNAIAEGSFAGQPRAQGLHRRPRRDRGQAHIAGLASPGGVHSHQRHIAAAATALAAPRPAGSRSHASLDGRDVRRRAPPGRSPSSRRRFRGAPTSPRSAAASARSTATPLGPGPAVRRRSCTPRAPMPHRRRGDRRRLRPRRDRRLRLPDGDRRLPRRHRRRRPLLRRLPRRPARKSSGALGRPEVRGPVVGRAAEMGG